LVETGYTVLVEAFESGIAHVLAQVVEGGYIKQIEHPVGQYQPAIKFEVVLGRFPASSLSTIHALFLVPSCGESRSLVAHEIVTKQLVAHERRNMSRKLLCG